MAKPQLADGFLGGKPRLSEMKLKTDSHKESEFRVIAENNIVIKFKTGQPVKVTTKLTQCSNDKELPDYVLVQRKDHDSINFHVGFPDNGYYTFMLFALPESDSNDSLPNVWNYLINVERTTRPAEPFVKAYTLAYKDSCYLHEPLILNSNSSYLSHTRFQVVVPKAYKVAVHTSDEWHQLQKKGDKWEGIVDLSKYKGKNAKVTINAAYDKDGTTYSVLYEYHI